MSCFSYHLSARKYLCLVGALVGKKRSARSKTTLIGKDTSLFIVVEVANKWGPQWGPQWRPQS